MSELKDIYIIGAGGSGKEAADTIRSINKVKKQYNILGFIDASSSLIDTIINDIPVKGNEAYLKKVAEKSSEKVYSVISIGDPIVKKKIAEFMGEDVIWENIIHPTAVISDYAVFGEGILIQAQGFVGANAVIGDHVQVNAKSNVSHDSIIGSYSSIMCLCDITGNVTLGDEVYVASSVSVIPGITINKSAKIGAGATVMKDVPPGVTMHGYRAVEAKK